MKKRNIAIVLAALLLVSVFAGCGAKNSSSDAAYQAYAEESYYVPAAAAAPAYSGGTFYDSPAAYEEAAYDYYDGDYYYEESGSMSAQELPEAALLSADAQETETQITVNPAKLIYTADLEMETLDFDAAVAALDKLTADLEGYYESSSMTESGSTRRAYYTVRIPAQNYRAFLDAAAGDICHVLSQQEYTQDVSEVYYDTAGRLETQKTKLARLQELLLQAEDMEDIITVESAISETEEMIDWYSGTLRRYDALVSYSTVDISLREVKVYEPEPDPTYGNRLGTAFTDGLKGFASGLGDILVALAYSWLWLVLIAVVVVLILWLTRKRRAAKKAARAEKKAARKARQEAAQNAPMTPISYSRPAETENKDE